ncbi:hypothetical protein QE152_g10357 [Popillia japonica]|uniref:Uncharacterized protein n=1 Tax=Popillia japonica TaxID=7064 RepID=A0AAW1LVV0_POPJA
MGFILITLFLLPTLISCQVTLFTRKCINITCPSYKSDKRQCKRISHVEDPFTNECVAKCDGPCINGSCTLCYCYYFERSPLNITSASICQRILMSADCEKGLCDFYPSLPCNGEYTHNPYHNYECLRRCDEESCGKGGTCSKNGHCVCHLGYRPDPTNPRICVKIPQNDNTTVLLKSCHKGFKLSDDGECVPTCGDCKNGCCGTDGVCQCWENYEWDVASATCVMVKDDVEVLRMSCRDK